MALVCDRCEGKQEVVHTVASLRTPNIGILSGLVLIEPNDPPPSADLCRPCRVSLTAKIKEFVKPIPSDQEG